MHVSKTDIYRFIGFCKQNDKNRSDIPVLNVNYVFAYQWRIIELKNAYVRIRQDVLYAFV